MSGIIPSDWDISRLSSQSPEDVMRVGVIIPARDEAEALPRVFRRRPGYGAACRKALDHLGLWPDAGLDPTRGRAIQDQRDRSGSRGPETRTSPGSPGIARNGAGTLQALGGELS